MDVERRIATLAAEQLGLFSRAQARDTGMTDKQLYSRIRDGGYEMVGRGVFAIAGLPWTWSRRARAAMLVVGPSARLSHRAAAHHLSFDGFGECRIEVVVPRGRRARTDLAIVHTTSSVHRLDLVERGGFPVTSGARTIIDLCSVGVSDEQLGAAIGSAMRDGLTSDAFLRKRLAALRGPGRRGIRLLDRALDGPIGHSHLEREFLRLVRGAGLEVPQTQVIMRLERVVRVDAMWPDARLVVEVMGHRNHSTAKELQIDAHRRNELQEIGLLVIELTTRDLAERPASSMVRVRRNLARRAPAAA